MFCSGCQNNTLHRQKRRIWQRLWLRAIYKCGRCGQREAIYWLDLSDIFTLTACCPRCGNTRLKRYSRLDHIEGLYTAPHSHWQRFLGAPLYYCFPCRLQFYDFRKPHEKRGA